MDDEILGLSDGLSLGDSDGLSLGSIYTSGAPIITCPLKLQIEDATGKSVVTEYVLSKESLTTATLLLDIYT